MRIGPDPRRTGKRISTSPIFMPNASISIATVSIDDLSAIPLPQGVAKTTRAKKMNTEDQPQAPTIKKSPENGMANSRHSMTMPERQIVALERISDQLALLAAEVLHAPELQDPGETTPPVEAPREPLTQWENEGGRLSETSPDIPEGIIRKRMDCYLVGSYRYTDLEAAIAELQRQKAESES